MYEEYYSSIPDKNAYLSRIGIDDHDLPPTVETLDRLIMAHLMHVPFENIDVYDKGMTPSLAISELFEKIVTSRRGGYCFELNAAFMSLLESVGFEVHAAAARILWRRDSYPPYSHRVSLVTINAKRYFCDVGFGGPSPTRAILLDDAKPQDSESGRFVVKTGASDTKTVFRITDEGPEATLLFIAQPFAPVDFIPLNFYIANNASSMFLSKRIANLKTRDGSAAIDGDILRIHSDNEVSETKLETVEDTKNALRQYFGIIIADNLKTVAAVPNIV